MAHIEPHDIEPIVLRLWHYGPQQAPYTWYVIGKGRGHFVRRTLDIEVNPPGAAGPLESEAALPPGEFAIIMGELQRVSVSLTASSELVLDAGSFGVEIARYPDPLVLTWAGAAPVGWESLEAWHYRTRHRLNKLLPRAAGLGYEYQAGGGLAW